MYACLLYTGMNDKTHQQTQDATGYELSIPMPGHTVTDDTKCAQDIDFLRDLITSHDVIYLLMDSRESRWLPTLLGAQMGKLVINAALGFDTYLVMRHGVRSEAHSQPLEGDPSNRLGCYYCNDVVAPADVSSQTSTVKWQLSRQLTMSNFAVINRQNVGSTMHCYQTWAFGHRQCIIRRADGISSSS